jgi:hypothetical protein
MGAMYLPDDLRDEHCKHVRQRFETVVDRFRKTASRTAIGALAFFVAFFIPFIRLGYTKAQLLDLQASIQSHLEARKAEFNAKIAKLRERRGALRYKEQMLARVDACRDAAEALEQLRRDVERDFTFPLEVPALAALPSKLTTAIPIAAAPWSVDWATGRHRDRIAHYRVMLATLNRISVHQGFLEDHIFAPVLAELDGASRFRTRQQAEEIREALLKLQQRVRGEFEAPLGMPMPDSSTGPSEPQNFGLWDSYSFEPGDPDGQFSAVLSASFRESLRADAADVTTQIEQLVENAPWKAALDEAWSELGLEQKIRQEIQSIGLTEDDLNGLLEQPILGDTVGSVSEQLDALQDTVDASGVDVWKLAAKLLESFEPAGSAEPNTEASTDRLAASVEADAKRRLQKELPAELEEMGADIASEEQKAADTIQRGMDRLRRKQDALDQRLGDAGKLLGGLPVSLEDAILLFPVLLAGGFLICCAQFREAARLRDIYAELTREESTSAKVVDLTSVLPFPLADVESRQLRRIAIGVPFMFQIISLILLLIFNRGGNASVEVDAADDAPAAVAVASPGFPASDSVATDDSAGSSDDSRSGKSPADAGGTEGETAGASATELGASDTDWIYLVAFLVSTIGMIWGAAYAATAFRR